jgi:hypothetical protein
MVTAVQAMDDHPVAGESEELVAAGGMVAAVQAMDDHLVVKEKLQVPEEQETTASEEFAIRLEEVPCKVRRLMLPTRV